MKRSFFFFIGAQYPVGRWFCRIRLLFLSSDAGLYKLVVYLVINLRNVIPAKELTHYQIWLFGTVGSGMLLEHNTDTT